MTRHFQSATDVDGHFALQLELAKAPAAPVDFWGQVENCTKPTSSSGTRTPVPLVEPDLSLIALQAIEFRSKSRPLRPIEYLRAVPDFRWRTAKTYPLAGSRLEKL
jgi:hypothetical protein